VCRHTAEQPRIVGCLAQRSLPVAGGTPPQPGGRGVRVHSIAPHGAAEGLSLAALAPQAVAQPAGRAAAPAGAGQHGRCDVGDVLHHRPAEGLAAVFLAQGPSRRGRTRMLFKNLVHGAMVESLRR